MKAFKYSFAAVLLIVAIASCQVADVDSPSGARRHDAPRFAASLESTRVYVDGDLQMYWTADDRISVFTCQGNDQYRFDGQTGDQTCTFTKISEDPMNPRDPLSANYSVYPYRLTTSIAADGVLTMRLPEEQPYASDSFGLGANTMVAVTEGPADYFLKFKNICGFLVVKLYGTGTVKSLVLEGSNGEKLAGKAGYLGKPVTEMVINKDGTASFWYIKEEHNYAIGDVNHDGDVNIADVTALIDMLLGNGNATCTLCADVKGDSEINIADVTALIDKLLN